MIKHKTINHVLRNHNFQMYGLDKEKNFMHAPICPCGCNKKGVIVTTCIEDIFELMCDTLEKCYIPEYTDCYAHTVIFACSLNGKNYAAVSNKLINSNDANGISILSTNNREPFNLVHMVEELDIQHYAILVEIQSGEWEILED